MKIPIGNQKLEVRLCISIRPNLKKLKKELESFFVKNEVEGHKIKKFRIAADISEIDYRIYPLEPALEECLSGEDNYEEKIKNIGKKYGIKNLGFVYYCYHK